MWINLRKMKAELDHEGDRGLWCLIFILVACFGCFLLVFSVSPTGRFSLFVPVSLRNNVTGNPKHYSQHDWKRWQLREDFHSHCRFPLLMSLGQEERRIYSSGHRPNHDRCSPSTTEGKTFLRYLVEICEIFTFSHIGCALSLVNESPDV